MGKSNITGGSSGSSSVSTRGSVGGMLKSCWCGANVVVKTSKSESNPNRRYFRCAFSTANKLMNDNHFFKWVDEALIAEIETLEGKIANLEGILKSFTTEIIDEHKKTMEKMQMQMEKDMFEIFEALQNEVKTNVKKMIVFVVIVCISLFGITTLLD